MSDKFEFDMDPVQKSVTVGGESYVVKEASGDASVKFRNAMLACMKWNTEGGVNEARGLATVEPLLVSLCLFRLDKDGKEHKVPEVVVRQWPSRVQKSLFTWIKKVSELDEEDTSLEALLEQREDLDEQIAKLQKDAAKNEPKGTTDGSG
jgi:hypothetical protein